MYVLWSTVSGGWLTQGGTYSSELADAWKMEWPDAQATCKNHFARGNAEFGLIPVELILLDHIRDLG